MGEHTITIEELNGEIIKSKDIKVSSNQALFVEMYPFAKEVYRHSMFAMVDMDIEDIALKIDGCSVRIQILGGYNDSRSIIQALHIYETNEPGIEPIILTPYGVGVEFPTED